MWVYARVLMLYAKWYTTGGIRFVCFNDYLTLPLPPTLNGNHVSATDFDGGGLYIRAIKTKRIFFTGQTKQHRNCVHYPSRSHKYYFT